MKPTTLGEESGRQNQFYTPQFEIRIDRAGLPGNVLRDVMQLTYKDNLTEIDSFEITVNNWDPERRDFKYAGSENPQLLDRNNPASRADRLFEPCNKKDEIRMGYVGELVVMMRGNFTTMEPDFSSGRGSTLTVRGLNVLHQLRRKQNTEGFPGRRDSQIAQQVARRFPIPIETDPNALGNEPEIEFVSQRNQYDVDFLFGRARQRGYVIYIRESEPRRLYFGPPTQERQGLRDVTFRLRWPGSLIDFKPTLTTANQVKSVTVHGWNRATRRAISETVTVDDPRLNRNRDMRDILRSCDPREERVVNEPVFTRRQAYERAIALLQERQYEMVKCTATTVGLPDLRAGKQVQIVNLGPRFSGTYFITESTHTIGEGGYTTRFSARRQNKGEGPQ